MKALNTEYAQSLEEIKDSIQSSELLQAYLDTEEEAEYRLLIEEFEPRIFELHQKVALNDPLQLLAFEEKIMKPEFEGLFIPKILGFTVLRGVITEEYFYHRPQRHFKKIVEYICGSANFDMLKIRIGQSLQMGLALSSDIWVTNLINQFSNKKIKYYLQSRNPEKYHYLSTRRKEYSAYSQQFKSDNFQTTFFPEDRISLAGDYPSLYRFLKYRVEYKYPTSSFSDELISFCSNSEFMGTKEHVDIFFSYLHFIQESENHLDVLEKSLKALSEKENFPQDYYQFRLDIQEEGHFFFKTEDERLQKIGSDLPSLRDFIETVMEIHTKGYIHDDAINRVKEFYNTHPGSSIENECIRKMLLAYFEEFLTNIDADEYEDYMDFSKIFPTYLEIFDNEHFTLGLREFNVKYLRLLLKEYTDKRGKDYQDIKKFVLNSWEDFGFYKQKELKEFFKSKRKKKV